MSEVSSTPSPGLLRSLGKLARGLSALFWGLPAALLVAAGTARSDWLQPLGFFPLAMVDILLVYGLGQMTDFQPQERPWRSSLDRAKLLAWINLGFSPFIYWHNRLPEVHYFTVVYALAQLVAGVLLFQVNGVLSRLGAMLPDETLRLETRQFTALNRWLLVLLLASLSFSPLLERLRETGSSVGEVVWWLAQGSEWGVIFLVLLPLAMTMALLWKTKEVIMDAVFGPR